MRLEPEVVVLTGQHERRLIYSIHDLLDRLINLALDGCLPSRLDASATGDFERLQKLLGVGEIEVSDLRAISMSPACLGLCVGE